MGLEGLCYLGNGDGVKEEERIAGRHVLMCVPERHLEMEKECRLAAAGNKAMAAGNHLPVSISLGIRFPACLSQLEYDEPIYAAANRGTRRKPQCL